MEKFLLSSLVQIYYSTFHLTEAFAKMSNKVFEQNIRGLLISAVKKEAFPKYLRGSK